MSPVEKNNNYQIYKINVKLYCPVSDVSMASVALHNVRLVGATLFKGYVNSLLVNMYDL